ncbi:hypothetical protein ACIBAI_24260 [Streptomyces sp. NPDC051041]|uniref:hypothetical protein n=1 Tax=Streptomyces sp. NPDC051041 TaxID=3365640 RepID=UPI0037A47066
MSRETDSPSSGPNGRGGAAYPSGTPPYGTPVASGDGAGRSATRPEDRKTETTLTTRIRINIPGSRPIPPVVVRKPVADGEGANGSGTDVEAPAPDATASMGAVESPAAPAQPAEEKKTSDWFAPRKPPVSKGGQGGGATDGAGRPGDPAGQGAGAPGGARPGGTAGAGNAPGGSRPGATNGAGLPGATGGPVAPGHGGGTGSFDVTEALAAGPLGNGSRADSGGTGPGHDDLPYFAEGGRSGPGDRDTRNGQAGHGGPGGFDEPVRRPGPQAPAGPTTGPVTGDGPMVPPMGGGATDGAGRPGGPGGPGGQSAPGAPSVMRAPGQNGTVPGGVPGPGVGRGPGGGLSDDTAILTPQKPAPEPGAPGYGTPADNVSGHTVTSGIPVVPTAGRTTPFGPGTPADGPLQHTPPKLPEPSPAGSAKPKKKGRSKLVLLGGGVILLAGVAYGAGLLMNHSDVPKGTTVLGVDIGGGTRDDAVKKLDDAFDDRMDKPLKLTVGGNSVSLEPDQAGLQFDTDATVDAAARSDYNPVSVIGSLFGNHRVVDPVMPVDEEKLQAALANVAGGSGSVTEGTIRFESGKAVAVYGKAGKGVDADKSADALREAYRTQVETGTSSPVSVPTTTRQPTVPDAEVDRMMKEFAEPAMSGLVTVKTADGAHTVAFSPEKSLWKFLGVKAQNGKLVEYYDQTALKELYGDTFDGVLITRGTGQKTPVTVQDVISALRPALKSTTDRVGVIETDPS